MSEILETKEVHTKWWVGLLTPQMLVYILVGVVALVTFWNNAKNTTADVDLIKKDMPTKVDASDFKALEDRVARQYETNNKILDRIVAVEKEQAYQKGLHEALQHK